MKAGMYGAPFFGPLVSVDKDDVIASANKSVYTRNRLDDAGAEKVVAKLDKQNLAHAFWPKDNAELPAFTDLMMDAILGQMDNPVRMALAQTELDIQVVALLEDHPEFLSAPLPSKAAAKAPAP